MSDKGHESQPQNREGSDKKPQEREIRPIKFFELPREEQDIHTAVGIRSRFF